MGSLGDFGQAKPQVADTFGWFGETIHVSPNLTDLVLMDFAEQAKGLDENDPRAMSFLKDQMRVVIAPDDFDSFWSTAVRNRQDSKDLMAVFKRIIESISERPTVLPSVSSVGQHQGVITYLDASSLLGTPVSPLGAADRRTIEGMTGRPDLALVVDKAARERAAS